MCRLGAIVRGAALLSSHSDHDHGLQLWLGNCPSLLAKAAIQAAYSLNVGNLRDTGHSAEAMPPAAMADHRTIAIILGRFVYVKHGLLCVSNTLVLSAHPHYEIKANPRVGFYFVAVSVIP